MRIQDDQSLIFVDAQQSGCPLTMQHCQIHGWMEPGVRMWSPWAMSLLCAMKAHRSLFNQGANRKNNTFNSDSVLHWNIRCVLRESYSMRKQTDMSFAMDLSSALRSTLVPSKTLICQNLEVVLEAEHGPKQMLKRSHPASMGQRSPVGAPRAPRTLRGSGYCFTFSTNIKAGRAWTRSALLVTADCFLLKKQKNEAELPLPSVPSPENLGKGVPPAWVHHCLNALVPLLLCPRVSRKILLEKNSITETSLMKFPVNLI